MCYAGEGDEIPDIKVQIEQRDRETGKKGTGRKPYEPYISIWVEIVVNFVLLRAIIEGMNAQKPVNTSDEFQDDWRDSDNNQCDPAIEDWYITAVVFYNYKSRGLREKR